LWLLRIPFTPALCLGSYCAVGLTAASANVLVTLTDGARTDDQQVGYWHYPAVLTDARHNR
jgi:hypothetical protein